MSAFCHDLLLAGVPGDVPHVQHATPLHRGRERSGLIPFIQEEYFQRGIARV
jgi:hypothetical protein